jgi:hypothetical protein
MVVRLAVTALLVVCKHLCGFLVDMRLKAISVLSESVAIHLGVRSTYTSCMACTGLAVCPGVCGAVCFHKHLLWLLVLSGALGFCWNAGNSGHLQQHTHSGSSSSAAMGVHCRVSAIRIVYVTQAVAQHDDDEKRWRHSLQYLMLWLNLVI